MQIYRHLTSLPASARGSVVAIGNFDGVHRGHQAVIARAASEARASGAAHGVLTFEPHPRSFFHPQDPPFRLTPFRGKAEALRRLGLERLYSLPFGRHLAALDAESFVRQVLVEGMAISQAVVGYDFVFGKNREGNASLLRDMAAHHGFGISIVEPVQDETQIFSSTAIRDALCAGRPALAAALLGRDWEIDGRVAPGDQHGRTIGFPTANLYLGRYLRPAAGVYAVRVGIDREALAYDGVAYFGTRPTVEGTDLRLEAHIFDYSGDLYGRHLRVAMIDYIRPDIKFAGVDALTAQIARDSDTARAILAQRSV